MATNNQTQTIMIGDNLAALTEIDLQHDSRFSGWTLRLTVSTGQCITLRLTPTEAHRLIGDGRPTYNQSVKHRDEWHR